jgi:type IV pilus assembly protein PilB
LIDFRVSTIPTFYGEKVVLRILDRSTVSLDLKTLDFYPEDLILFKKVIKKPYGMILLTGPTGSGKTTTLYSALNEIKSVDKNITTIEDPIEYQLNGINQVQVKPSIGLTFASGLRSFLRQDPDVLLVGEIRDLETAQIAVTAALTGHLVLSTLHTNDAPTAVSRLMDIGIEPFYVGSSLLLVVAQRLMRKLCPKCKEIYQPLTADFPTKMKLGSVIIDKLYRPKGCEACAYTGYMGRMAVFEMMRINEEIEQLIMTRASVSDIRAAAKKAGMLTLEENGLKKIAAGETSLAELMRVISSSD